LPGVAIHPEGDSAVSVPQPGKYAFVVLKFIAKLLDFAEQLL